MGIGAETRQPNWQDSIRHTLSTRIRTYVRTVYLEALIGGWVTYTLLLRFCYLLIRFHRRWCTTAHPARRICDKFVYHPAEGRSCSKLQRVFQ